MWICLDISPYSIQVHNMVKLSNRTMDYEQNSAGRHFLSSDSFCRVIGIESGGGRYNYTLGDSATFLHAQQEIVSLFCLECDLAQAFVHVDHKESPSSCILLSQFSNIMDEYYLI